MNGKYLKVESFVDHALAFLIEQPAPFTAVSVLFIMVMCFIAGVIVG